tara:strand:+ start:174 stop:1004 length:831 start_codon:yes stop_codon:yes gene_type:complete
VPQATAEAEAPQRSVRETTEDEILEKGLPGAAPDASDDLGSWGEAQLDAILDERAPEIDLEKEDVGDVAHEMASAQDAEESIVSGILGARKIYHKYGDDILRWSTGSGVDPFFALAIMGVETGGEERFIRGPTVSSAGAAGIGQFMPKTWASASRKVYGDAMPSDKRFDPQTAGPVVFYYLKHLDDMGFHTQQEVAAAYKAGRGRVRRFKQGKIESLPVETRRYITAVMAVAHLIEREILSETVPQDEPTPEGPASDMMDMPQTDEAVLGAALKGG